MNTHSGNVNTDSGIISKSVHVKPESLFTFIQYRCSLCSRIGVHFEPEYADDSTAEINITFKVNLLVEFSYAPDEAIFYDSEDKRYYYMDHTQSSFKIDKIIPVYLELDIEDTSNIDLLNVNVEEIEETIEYYEPYDY